MSWAVERRQFNSESWRNRLSRFVEEIEDQYVEVLVPKSSTRRKSYTQEEESDPFPNYEDFSQVPAVSIGSAVNHVKFGPGVVTKIEGAGQNLKLTVNFRNAGQKKLLYQYARNQLEIL